MKQKKVWADSYTVIRRRLVQGEIIDSWAEQDVELSLMHRGHFPFDEYEFESEAKILYSCLECKPDPLTGKMHLYRRVNFVTYLLDIQYTVDGKQYCARTEAHFSWHLQERDRLRIYYHPNNPGCIVEISAHGPGLASRLRRWFPRKA